MDGRRRQIRPHGRGLFAARNKYPERRLTDSGYTPHSMERKDIHSLSYPPASSAPSTFFYLRVVRLMYMEEPDKSFSLSLSPALSVALLLAAVGVIGLGIAPGPVLDMAGSAIMGFMR